MSLMPFLHESSGAGGDVVKLPNLISFTNEDTSGTVFSGIRFGSDGNIYRLNENGNFGVVGQWLVSGTASSFYVTRTIDSGSLTTDAGAGPLQLNANRDYYLFQEGTGSNQAMVTFEIEDSGTNTLAGPKSYTFTAEVIP